MNIKKKGLWTLVAFTLAALTIVTIMKGSGMTVADFLDAWGRADKRWLAVAFLCMLGYIGFEGMAVRSILRISGYPRRHRQGVLYGAADVYFSAITPSATGGQPACAYFIIRDGTPAAVATAVLLLNLIMYNAAIITLGLITLLIRPGLFLHFQPICKILIGVGALVILLLTGVFVLLLWKQQLMAHIAEQLIRLLQRMHILKRPERAREKVRRTLEEYKSCVSILAGRKKMWLEAYLFNVLQRTSQILVSGCVYFAMGGRHGIVNILATQCYVTLGANCVPIPGAMGVTDYLMLDGYMNLLSREAAFEVQMLSRTISFYICIAISGLIVLAGWIWQHKKRYGKKQRKTV